MELLISTSREDVLESPYLKNKISSAKELLASTPVCCHATMP